MLRKRLVLVFGMLVLASMLLAACGPKATATPGQTQEPTAPTTTRHGGWLDEIDYSQIEGSTAIAQVQAGAIDIFSYGLASDKLADIQAANLCYTSAYGTYYSILANPAVFTDTTKLNPFTDHKIREALNWLIDRNYINQEIYAGGALPKWEPIVTQLVDYTGIIDSVRGVEAHYAYNLDEAKQVIATEMQTLGATLGTDGKWQYQGNPVTIIFLIRNDGDGTRLKIGDYVSDQLEKVGFTVDREYKKSSEAAPIWDGTDPVDGQWSLYTAGWVNNGLQRDEKTAFRDHYLAESGNGNAWNANVPDPAFHQAAMDLANGNFTSLQQRHDLMVQAATLAPQDSLQTWVVDLLNYAPYNCKLDVTYDVGSGVEVAQMFPYNLALHGQEGGQVRVATATLFSQPWNPVNGSNWVSDAMVQYAVQGYAFMPDPYTGLSWPLRAESAEVTIQTGLPAGSSLPWVTLNTADTIQVPADAWVGWDATTQKFKLAGDGVTAKVKIVVHYPADLFQTVKWHDGSAFSVADIVMGLIETFDIGDPASANYDESYVPVLQGFESHFKGFRIASTDPLVIERYDDNYYQDAELDASILGGGIGWANYTYGEAPWESIAIGNSADASGELSWSSDKATAKNNEWMSFIGGPSLAILSTHLDQAIAAQTIPFAATLGQFITADQATARYQALKAWYAAHGTFWDGTGPYYVDSIDLNAGSAVVKQNPNYPDLSDRWSNFSTPPLGSATLDGPAQVKIGQDAVFNLTVTTKAGDPYPTDQINAVKFLLYDATGATVYVGEGVASGTDGQYTLTVPSTVTSTLVSGSGRIEAAAVFIPIAIPAFATLDYVVAP